MQWLVRQVFAQMVGGFADLALTGQENEDVSPAPAHPKLIGGICYGFVQAVVAAFFKGAVALLYREGAAADHNHGRRPVARGKMLGKAVCVNGGRRDNDF